MCSPNSVQVFLKTNRQIWDSNPHTQTVLDEQSNAWTTRPPCLTIVHLFVNCHNKKKLSNQTIVRSKLDLTSWYLKCNDEFSTLVLEQEFNFRPNRFAEISNFSKKTVTAFKLSVEAKQKQKEVLILICSHLKTIIFFWEKTGPKNKLEFFRNSFTWIVPIEKRVTLADRFSLWKCHCSIARLVCLTNLKCLRANLSPEFCDLVNFLVSF